MKKDKILGTLMAVFFLLKSVAMGAEKPNIVLIFTDDMGYGDVQCLNPERGKILTPHMDRLAAEGMIFSDAHTSSSVCTPSRYSLLTGRYCWRTTRQSGVTMGFSGPLIPTSRLTVASLLQSQGYNTGMIGKWHLGLDLPQLEKDAEGDEKRKTLGKVDWKAPIAGGPTALGFDYFFGISASLDISPFIYIENENFVGECTTRKEFGRTGPAHVDFEAVDVLDDFAEKAIAYIGQQDESKPFFAYIALTSPHTPIVPTAKWLGKSGLSLYGDFQMQTDDFVGQIAAAIEAGGFSENTLFIVTSDNGCARAADIKGMEEKGHFPSAHLRGSKADLWEGGHRVPFIVRWPGKVAAGSQSDEVICLTDVMATCAEITGAEVPVNAGEDSVSFLPALKGEAITTERTGIVNHSISGHFAYRQDKWKLLLAKGSGGWSSPKEGQMPKGSPKAQLYDLSVDPGETTNLYLSHPEVAAELLLQLESDVARGRSNPGPEQANDTESIRIWKGGGKK